MDVDEWTAYIGDILGLLADEFGVEQLMRQDHCATVRVTLRAAPRRVPEGMADLSTLACPSKERTLVLKHLSFAPAYFRQDNEARALAHVARDPALSCALSASPPAVVPAKIYHDTTRRVLWISDIGRRQRLGDYLDGEGEAPDAEADTPRAAQLGAHLGNVMARLHLAALHPRPELLAQFGPPDGIEERNIADTVKTVRGAIERRGYVDAKALSTPGRLGLDRAGGRDGASVWSMGEICADSVRLPLPLGGSAGGSGVSGDAALALMDSEWPVARHPGAEVGSILSDVRAAGVRALHPASSSRADAFARALAAAYVFTAPHLSRTPAFRRQALCAYGRQLVDNANCEPNLEVTPLLVDEGVAALRAASDDEDWTLSPGHAAPRQPADPAAPVVALDIYFPSGTGGPWSVPTQR